MDCERICLSMSSCCSGKKNSEVSGGGQPAPATADLPVRSCCSSKVPVDAPAQKNLTKAFSACFSPKSLLQATRDFMSEPGYQKLRIIFASAVVAGVAAAALTSSPMVGMYVSMAASLALFGTFKHLGGEAFVAGFPKYDFIASALSNKAVGPVQDAGQAYARSYPYLEQAQALVYTGAAFMAAAGGHYAPEVVVPALILTAATKVSETIGAFKAVQRGEAASCPCVGGGSDAPPIGPVTILENVAMASMPIAMLAM